MQQKLPHPLASPQAKGFLLSQGGGKGAGGLGFSTLPTTSSIYSQKLIRKFLVTKVTAFNHQKVNFHVICLCFPVKVITLEIEAPRLLMTEVKQHYQSRRHKTD
ncbi:MAG: hypothetical protein RID09_00370 [Coleofasciculus sp. G1-WW12-02]|uniref:hypothetical protein n=1 Tax=unclassified Coleofasciculus TaxID=2692782 RepID=UPI00330347FE